MMYTSCLYYIIVLYLTVIDLEKLERYCNALYGHRLSLTPTRAGRVDEFD